MKSKKEFVQRGFTLAEVLITLGIIGVVAALTLPTLIQKNKEVELTSRAKKSYSTISQAVKMVEAKNETPGDLTVLFDGGGNPNAYELTKNFAKYFNGAKVCQNASEKGCANYYYKISYAIPRTDGNGTLTEWDQKHIAKIILPDETVIGIQQYPSCDWLQTSYKTDSFGNILKDDAGNNITVSYQSHICADIIFDTNGSKNPNKFGADAFAIQVFKNKIAPSMHKPFGADSFNSLITNGQLIFTNYKSGERLDF